MAENFVHEYVDRKVVRSFFDYYRDQEKVTGEFFQYWHDQFEKAGLLPIIELLAAEDGGDQL